MKKAIRYILSIIALSAVLVSCADDWFDGQNYEGPVSMRIVLSLPASGEAQTRGLEKAGDASTDEGTLHERYLDASDLHVLVFEAGKLVEDVKDLKLQGSAGDATRTLTATTVKSYKSTIDIVVMANLQNRKINDNFESLMNKSKEEVYKSLKFNYSDENGAKWEVSNKNYIPMWGAHQIEIPASNNEFTIGMYRAVSRVDVVNKAIATFTLKSVRVYFAHTEGYATPLTEPANGDPVQAPSVADLSQYTTITHPQAFTGLEGDVCSNQIYIPEAKNRGLTGDQRAVCLVVGGVYTGNGLVDSGKESYYRVDFKTNAEGAYDALRNHLYQFTINTVTTPGTPTPEDALDKEVVGLDVTLAAWDETLMRGLTNQYSLVTDRSWISFARDGVNTPEAVVVESDHGNGWEIVDMEASTGSDNLWFTARKENGKVMVTANSVNNGAARTGSFYIRAGQLKKKIYVEQAQPETSNCYVVGVGNGQQISVVVKGNGTPGLFAENKDGSRVQLDNSADIAPAYLKIIWETEQGLIELVDPKGGVKDQVGYNTDGLLTFNVTNKGSLPYYPNPADHATAATAPGGNALIGAFNAQGKVIWSWHIWVCPDMARGIKTENWSINGYNVIDRNLGALSNQPGVASLGLLYQWGRKDPFIGAAEINDSPKTIATKNYGHAWGIGRDNDRDITYTIQHPTKLTKEGLSVTDTEKGPFLWGTNGGLDKAGVKDLGVKTIYDPCPIGYRVPPVDAFVFDGEVEYIPTSSDRYNLPGYKAEDYLRDGEACWGRFFYDKKESITGPARIQYIKESAGTIHEILGVEEIADGVTKQLGGIRVGYAYRETKRILTKSSETENWLENLVYIPNNAREVDVYSDEWVDQDYMYAYNVNYVKNAPYYGYYLNHKEVKAPEMKDKMNDFYSVKSSSSLSWFPLSGAYDPKNEKGFTFEGVTVEEGPSLTVNSFVWTNSSVTGGDGVTRPGAMFLHGANPKAEKKKDGRHIHALIRGDIKAEPRYAGAVRCVRDEKKDFSSSNQVDKNEVTIKQWGPPAQVVLKSINDTWQVVDPGASWLKISPDRGIADKGRGQNIDFTSRENNSTGSDRVTTVKIKIGEKIFSVKVTQALYY